MSVRLRALLIAAVAAVAYTALGRAVSHAPPGPLDLAGTALTGQATLLAVVLTSSCWWPVLAVLGVAALAVAAFVPEWRTRVFFAIAVTLAGWQISDGLKLVFARPRPPVWIAIHETSFSYASGHALFAVLVFLLWSWYLANSRLPKWVRVPASMLFALWGLGVIWSRLALGAHYVTDLIGGVLLAIGVLSIGIAVAPKALSFATERLSWHTG